jgi:hypothetical protein
MKKLISDNFEQFNRLQPIIKDILKENLFIFEMKSLLMTQEELKHTMFDRVKRNDVKFRLFNNLNDIICFHLVNPWTKNCMELSKILIQHPDLRIVKKNVINRAICLVGEMATGTTFQIIVMPTLIDQFLEWKKIHRGTSSQTVSDMLIQSTKLQDTIDATMIIR